MLSDDTPRPNIVTSTRTLESEALALRRDILQALFRTGGGHYGGCMSVVDLLLVLARTQLRVDPKHPDHPVRDRLILSKGHAALALYAVLRLLGFFDVDLDTYATYASPLEGHPDGTTTAGVDFSTGSLGQGLSVGLGMALGLVSKGPRVWVVLGDGECQEGQVWEAAMLAGRYAVRNLIAVIDCNRHQEYGWPSHLGDALSEPVFGLDAKWRSFGWRVLHCEGHDHQQLTDTFEQATEDGGMPTVVVAHTIKGKGASLLENAPERFHCASVSEEEHRLILQEVM